MNTDIQQFDKTVRQNAGATEELASTSEELSDQAERLLSEIEFFKFKSAGYTSNQQLLPEPKLLT